MVKILSSHQKKKKKKIKFNPLQNKFFKTSPQQKPKVKILLKHQKKIKKKIQFKP